MAGPERFNGNDFSARGAEFGAAWRTLHARCEVPPSLEVFEHELEARQKKESLTPQALATRLADAYHRVRGLLDGEA